MNNSEFFEAVRLLSKEKNVSESALLEGIQRAIVTAVKRDYNNKDIVFCEIDEQDKKIRVFVRRTSWARSPTPMRTSPLSRLSASRRTPSQAT